MDFIEVNDTALRYEPGGSGPHTVVLLHDIGDALESWDLAAPQLAVGSRVLRDDRRGAGRSEKIGGSLALDTMVGDLIADVHDAMRPPVKVEAIAGSISNARYLLLPAGHCAALQTPEILTTAVLEFIASSVT
jgi:3-oxoadipate enol-lactonase